MKEASGLLIATDQSDAGTVECDADGRTSQIRREAAHASKHDVRGHFDRRGDFVRADREEYLARRGGSVKGTAACGDRRDDRRGIVGGPVTACVVPLDVVYRERRKIRLALDEAL